MVQIWDNPRCSKCAAARTAAAAAGLPVALRAYLTEPPTPAELADVLRRAGLRAWELCRLGEPVAAELGLQRWPRDGDAEPRWIAAMCAHPQLIQRPVILPGDGSAVVARTPEALAEALRRAR